MPKLFLANVEEALSSDDILYSHFYSEKSTAIYGRMLAELHPGDRLVIPCPLDTAFCDYFNRLTCLGNPDNVVLNVGSMSSRLLADIFLSNSDAIMEVHRNCPPQDWYLEPFYESVDVLRLAKVLQLPTKGTSPDLIHNNLIEEYNDKGKFKRMARRAGLPTVSGTSASNSIELVEQIRSLGKRYPRLMLRKVKYAGGAGNLAGTAQELLDILPDWYNRGVVLVEPFLDIEEICGSLVLIEDEKVTFLCADRQIIVDNGWCGFTTPFCTRGAEERYSKFNLDAVYQGTLKLAQAAQVRGARGLMNLDWAFIRNHPDLPCVLECNFRHNGLGYIMTLAESYFGSTWRDQSIFCRERIPCNEQDFASLHKRLRELRWHGEEVFIDGPGMKRGLIVTNPPRDGKFSIAIFGPDQQYIDEIVELISGPI